MKIKEILKGICSLIYRANLWYENIDTRKRELVIVISMIILIALKPIISVACAVLFLIIRGMQGYWLEWSDIEVIDAEIE